MEIKINIRKKHFYLLSSLVILIGSIIFVQGQGASNFGHDASTIKVNVDGEIITLQEAIDEGNIGRDIAMDAGPIKHGKMIPLPEGYEEQDCKWMVSILQGGYSWYLRSHENCFTADKVYDYAWNGKYPDDYKYGRYVTCITGNGYNANHFIKGDANYMIVCQK